MPKKGQYTFGIMTMNSSIKEIQAPQKELIICTVQSHQSPASPIFFLVYSPVVAEYSEHPDGQLKLTGLNYD